MSQDAADATLAAYIEHFGARPSAVFEMELDEHEHEHEHGAGCDHDHGHDHGVAPRIRIARFDASATGRNLTVYVSVGMSHARMELEDEAARDGVPARAELILYTLGDVSEDAVVPELHWIAEFPFVDRTWLGVGHTLPLDEPVLGTKELSTLLLLSPLDGADQSLGAKLAVEGEPVELLWVVPISAAETALEHDKGFDALMDLFEEREHPLYLDLARTSYV